jgi:Mg2+/Co2+ transporter CorC
VCHQNATDNITVRDLARDVLLVSESRRIDEVLKDLQRRKSEMAVVIDEWGSFEGILTVEGIVEQIVGEIRGEFDEEEPAIRRLPDGSYSIDSRTSIQRVNETLGSKFESEDFDTIGGLVLEHLGRAPKVGDEVRSASTVTFSVWRRLMSYVSST